MDAGKSTPLGTRYVERFLRRWFNTVGPVVTQGVRGDVLPVLEVRPWRSDEYREFGIIPWKVFIQQGAVVGENSGYELQAVANYDLVVLGVLPLNDLFERVNGTGNGLATNTDILPVENGYAPMGTGLQWGQSSQRGSAAAPAGTIVGTYAANILVRHDPIAILRSTPALLNFWSLWTTTQNAAFTATVWGIAVPVEVANL